MREGEIEKRELFFEGEGGLADVLREEGDVIYFCGEGGSERGGEEMEARVYIYVYNYGRRGKRRKGRRGAVGKEIGPKITKILEPLYLSIC